MTEGVNRSSTLAFAEMLCVARAVSMFTTMS